jgi:hypothetical protein
MNDVFISPSNVAINSHQNENEILSQSSTSPVLPLNESPFETLHYTYLVSKTNYLR